MKYYETKNIRIKRYLYTLGFDYTVYIDDRDKNEVFAFVDSDELQSAIQFFINARAKNK